MRTKRLGFMALVVIALTVVWAGPEAAAKPISPPKLCQAQLTTCNTNLSTCNTNLATSNASLGTCTTELNQAKSDLSACTTQLAAAQKFPATGQTTCWDGIGVIACGSTGQDGDIRAGAALSYTDNGDGTITDNNTKLMWEKKSDDGTIHDMHTFYRPWANAFAVHIAGLNDGGGFAGYTDWRLPNVKELQSIVNYENAYPAVSPVFHNNCTGSTVLTGSCTYDSSYWSSTIAAFELKKVWAVSFEVGHVNAPETDSYNTRVRAVRGGS